MFQDHPLLIQLKQQLYDKELRMVGVVKSTDKGFGFLEVNAQKSYFIPPLFMKKVMHGDKISAVLRIVNNRAIAEPETLIEPFLSRFVGKVQIKNDKLALLPKHPLIKEIIPASQPRSMKNTQLCHGDWVIAEMCHHPLDGYRYFYAKITELITTKDDNFAHWRVTLAHYNLEREAPAMPKYLTIQDNGLIREDLTELNFITIDHASTEDIDDALHVAYGTNGALVLTIAIADPTAWIIAGSQLDCIARDRAFTNYLPGFNIPMLPRMLSEDLCSLRAYEKRPALVCQVTMQHDGTLNEDMRFFAAWIESKAKLSYDEVSDWIENIGFWQPQNNAIAEQIRMLHIVCQARSSWRKQHALVFKDKPDYRFILEENGNVKNIIAEPRRIAKRMIEEAMITANICAARVLRDNLGFGLYNTHNGFDTTLIDQVVAILQKHNISVDATQLLTLEGFCALRRKLNTMSTSYLDSRIRRFQTLSELKTEPGPHFGLGLEVYATWTSPIRKYSDMMNHRLLKALIGAGKAERPKTDITFRMSERRRQNRIAERDVEDWLYASFLKNQVGSHIRYSAEIIDIYRNGMRIRLLDNGAIAFIPALLIHNIRDELICNQDIGIVQIQGKERYRQGDTIEVYIKKVHIDNRSIIAKIV